MTPVTLNRLRFVTPGTTIVIVGDGETFTPCNTVTTVSLRTAEAYAIRAEAEAVSLRDAARLSNHLKEEVEHECGCSGCVALMSKRGQICKSCQRQRQKLHAAVLEHGRLSTHVMPGTGIRCDVMAADVAVISGCGSGNLPAFPVFLTFSIGSAVAPALAILKFFISAKINHSGRKNSGSAMYADGTYSKKTDFDRGADRCRR